MFCIVALMIHVKHANQNITLYYMSLGSNWENHDRNNTEVSICVAYMIHLVWNVGCFLLTVCSVSWISTNVFFVTQFKTGQPLKIISYRVQKYFHIAEVMQDAFSAWSWIWQLTKQQGIFKTVLTVLSLLVRLSTCLFAPGSVLGCSKG